MNGIKTLRDGAFGLTILALFGAIFYEYGKRRETVEYLFERWDAYQGNCLRIALAALIVTIVLSLIASINDQNRRRRRREDAILVTKTRESIFSELDREREEKEKLYAKMGCDRNGYPKSKA